MSTQPAKTLETFPNPKPDRPYVVTCETPEFTCLCPKTGQPDFANVRLEYIPHERCFELKAFKLYLWSYRNAGAFHEAVCNTILDDLVAAVQPAWMQLTLQFYVRGGITTTVTAVHGERPCPDPAP